MKKPVSHKGKANGKSNGDALLSWHLQHRGVYARVARKLDIDASYVSRVAKGDRDSDRIRQALLTELERIHRMRP